MYLLSLPQGAFLPACLFPGRTGRPGLDVCFSPQSMHQQQQLQHQQFQKELEKIQLLQQQQLPFHAPGDMAPDAELLDSSGLYSESSGTSSPSTSPRASNHSLHSSGSASRTGASPFPEQDDEGKASGYVVLFSLSFDHHPSWDLRGVMKCHSQGFTLFSPHCLPLWGPGFCPIPWLLPLGGPAGGPLALSPSCLTRARNHCCDQRCTILRVFPSQPGAKDKNATVAPFSSERLAQASCQGQYFELIDTS